MRKFIFFLRYLYVVLIYYNKIKTNIPSYIGFKAKFLIYKTTRIYFKGKFNIRSYVEIGGQGKIFIGDKFGINAYSRIIAKGEILIGDNVLIARYVSILDHDHNISAFLSRDNNKYDIQNIIIGNNVWIGDKVTILKGVKIGNNVIIGSNSVVTKDISDNQIVAGIPAKLIKKIE